MKQKLSLSPGQIELHVKDLSRERDFYTDVLGLEIQKEDKSSVILGKAGTSLLELYHKENLIDPMQKDAGLYHFAILFESRGDLARTVATVLKKRPELFSGSADHLVSEAFYLSDPEGNGIELYFDRDKSVWNWENSTVSMATIYLDPENYLAQNVTLEEPNKSVKMGHFHLKVGNIEQARHFYVDILGFEVTAKYPGALFISVNGYHHHLGLNTWESEGAGLRNESLGLKSIEFRLSHVKILEYVQRQLEENNINYSLSPKSITFSDPWGNRIVMTIHA